MSISSRLRRYAAVVTAAAAVFSGFAQAAPANPELRQFRQPDGSVFTARPGGDEWLSWYETQAGRIALFDRASGAFEYAKLGLEQGRIQLLPSGIRVGRPNHLPTISPHALLQAWRNAHEAAEAGAGGSGDDSTAAALTETTTAAAGTGNVYPTLIVLVEWNDYQVRSDDNTWSHKFFGGYPGAVAAGTVNDYFREVANGKVWFTPAGESGGSANDGVVRVRLARNHPQLAKQMSDWRPVLYQALQAADPQVDFGRFDRNGDGELSKNELQIAFVVAGHESSWNSDESAGLWGHAWSFPDSSEYPLLDGLRVGKNTGRYFAIGERHGRTDSPYDAVIGIICHELGHAAFYLPDLYKDPYSISYWGLMGVGSWGARPGEAQGTTPVHMLAYTKAIAQLPTGQGFLQPRVLEPTSVAQRLSLTHALDPDAYEIFRVAGPDGGSFYFEQRKVAGYDEGLMRLGLAAGDTGVLVSYRASYAELQLYRASGANNGTRLADLYYQGNNDRLAPTTSPSSATPGGSYTGLVLENVSEPAEQMSLDLRWQAYPCREYVASNTQHVDAGRAYTHTSGYWWNQRTEYYANGSGDYLGAAGYTQVTLSESQPGHYEQGECPSDADTVAPVITLLGAATVDVELGASFTDPGATATDDRDGDISSRIVVSGSVNTAVAGTYVLRYNVSDAAGNAAAEVRRTVRVAGASACTQYLATVADHISAGRAYQCGSWNFYGCATGSGTSIGSRFSTTRVTLRKTAPNYYELGSCQ